MATNYYIDLITRLRETLYTFKITLQWDSDQKAKDIEHYDDFTVQVALKEKIETNAKAIENINRQISEINTAVSAFEN